MTWARPESQAVVLHSSWTGVIGAALGSALVLFMAGLVAAGGASFGIKVAMAGFAALATLATLFDMPVVAEFDSAGVTRRNLLRRHRLEWNDVERLKRTRVGIWRHTPKRRGGGLVAQIGFRHYLLVDRMESRAEFDQVRAAIGIDLAEALGLGPDLVPPDNRKPTWRRSPASLAMRLRRRRAR